MIEAIEAVLQASSTCLLETNGKKCDMQTILVKKRNKLWRALNRSSLSRKLIEKFSSRSLVTRWLLLSINDQTEKY
jgi:hypothetical protein